MNRVVGLRKRQQARPARQIPHSELGAFGIPPDTASRKAARRHALVQRVPLLRCCGVRRIRTVAKFGPPRQLFVGLWPEHGIARELDRFVELAHDSLGIRHEEVVHEQLATDIDR